MIGRIAFLLAISLSSSVTADEPTSFYNAPYEVVTDDPSCNGPGAALIRMRLEPSEAFIESWPAKEGCYTHVRRGLEANRELTRCPEGESSEFSLDPEDELRLWAEIELCRMPLGTSYISGRGEISGMIDGEAVSKNLELEDLIEIYRSALPLPRVGFDDIPKQNAKQDILEFTGQVDAKLHFSSRLILKLYLNCPMQDIHSGLYDNHEISFQLFKHEAETCPQKICQDESNQQSESGSYRRINVNMHCAEQGQETRP